MAELWYNFWINTKTETQWNKKENEKLFREYGKDE